MDLKAVKVSKWFIIESYFNTINHVLNGTVALYMTWFCYNIGWSKMTTHIYLTTIGYQLLMAEGIMTLYSANSWTYFHSKATKRFLHWIVQALAAIAIVSGNVLIICIKKSGHFNTIHGVTGKFLLLLLTIFINYHLLIM